MTRILLISLLLLCFSPVSSQVLSTGEDQQKSVMRLHVITPGLLLEAKAGENASCVLDLGTGVSFYYTEQNGEPQSGMYLNPFFRIEPRLYFNQEKRRSMGKRTDYFSGQYLCLQLKLGFPTSNTAAWKSIGPLWGF